MKTKRDMLASALIVLSIAIKPYGALLLPVVLVRRQRAAIVATAVGCLLLLLLPVPLYGWSGTVGLHPELVGYRHRDDGSESPESR